MSLVSFARRASPPTTSKGFSGCSVEGLWEATQFCFAANSFSRRSEQRFTSRLMRTSILATSTSLSDGHLVHRMRCAQLWAMASACSTSNLSAPADKRGPKQGGGGPVWESPTKRPLMPLSTLPQSARPGCSQMPPDGAAAASCSPPAPARVRCCLLLAAAAASCSPPAPARHAPPATPPPPSADAPAAGGASGGEAAPDAGRARLRPLSTRVAARAGAPWAAAALLLSLRRACGSAGASPAGALAAAGRPASAASAAGGGGRPSASARGRAPAAPGVRRDSPRT